MYEKVTDEQYFTIRKSDRFCAGFATDLVIEQSMMRRKKIEVD